MTTAALSKVVNHCDRILRTASIRDYSGAVNGLQVENRGRVSRVGAAVDASLATVRMARQAGVDLLVVHHGLFWGASHPWTGKRRALLQELIEGNLAVYSSHLPLDMHARLGNNFRLCAALDFKGLTPFFDWKDQKLGFQTRARIDRDELASRLRKATGIPPKLLPGGARVCRRIGVVTGGAGAELATAAREGVDTFITGEGPHWTYALAEEHGINVFYAGHYATETFGVKALGAHLSKKFRLPWTFLDHPTGL
jgi:dinuclear metal center YbgI/SA1388 family protein